MSTGRALDAGRVTRWLSAAVAAVAVAALGATGSASAGTYEVWSCRGPDGAALGSAAWGASAINPESGGLIAPDGVSFDDCGDGGPLSVALAQSATISAPIAGLLTFQAPADTRIARYTLSRRLTRGTPPLLVNYLAAWNERAAGSPVAGGDLCDTAGCMFGDVDPDSPTSVVERLAPTGDAIELRAEVACLLDLCLNALSGPPARAELYWSRVTLEDVVPPEQPQIAATLAEGAATALTVVAEDRGGGVETLSLDVDGQPWKTVRMGATDATCRTPYTVPAPCPSDAEHAFEIDTGALEPGDHQASGTVVDAAGNGTAWGPVPFRVERPPTTIVTPPRGRLGPSNGTPAVERPRLRLARASVEADAGRDVRLRGRLTTLAGTPIRGARLEVTARQLGLRGTVPNRSRPTVVTDARGRFAVEQRAFGARRVTVVFSPRPDAAGTARAVAIVRSRLSLTTAPSASRIVKGRRLRLRGRLLGAGPSARGALVQIQAVVNGRWSPVGRARAGRGGRYAWRYRFVHLTRDTVFRFRAVVEHVPGWPWPTVRGAPTAVRVDVP